MLLLSIMAEHLQSTPMPASSRRLVTPCAPGEPVPIEMVHLRTRSHSVVPTPESVTKSPPILRWGRACLGTLLLTLATLCASAASPKRVLLIHSFTRDFAPFNTFSAILRTELVSQSPEPVDVFEVSLESARSDDPVLERPLVDYLLALLSGHRLDLVVPIGGPAARFAQRHRQALFADTPMLIAATDQRHIQQATLTTNDAVVAARNEPSRVLQTILELLPQTTNVVVVIGASPLEKFWLREIREACQGFPSQVGFQWLNEISFAEMLKRCAALPPGSAVFYALLAVDVEGVPHWEEGSLTRLHETANAPLFGLHDTQLGRGIVGGPLMGIEELSRNTARVALRILAGERPSDLRPPPQGPGTPRFDWRELQRWGISETRLPAGSLVLFRQPGFWDLYRGRIIAIIALCFGGGALIVLLVATSLKARGSERSLRESEDRMSLAAAAAGVGVWMWDIARNQIWATENWRRMFGFPAEVPIRYETFLERVHPEDRPAVDRAVQRALEDRADYVSEHRVVLPDGTERWIAARGRVHLGAAAQPQGMLGASVDISDRKRAEEAARTFGGLLISAQEEERAPGQGASRRAEPESGASLCRNGDAGPEIAGSPGPGSCQPAEILRAGQGAFSGSAPHLARAASRQADSTRFGGGAEELLPGSRDGPRDFGAA